jgi:hypothetical protein
MDIVPGVLGPEARRSGNTAFARWKFLSFVSAALLFQAGIAMVGFAETPACTQNTQLVGQCFTVQGRLSVHANMRPYLWPSGTHRLLGIASTDGAIIMPPEIERIFASPPFDRQLFADFDVCPFTRPRPGIMQMVCIAAARHLKIHRAE